jgi:3-methyladenine DNA glycosylase Tag
MEAPARIRPKSPDDYLEQLSKGVFQAGISWRVVEAKWVGITAAFHRFKLERVARMSDREIDGVAQDPRVIRSRPKIAAVVHNARVILDLEREEGFRAHLRSIPEYEELAADLKKRFKFVGDSGAYHFLYSVSHPVPDWHEWAQAHGMVPGGAATTKRPGRSRGRSAPRARTRPQPAPRAPRPRSRTRPKTKSRARR